MFSLQNLPDFFLDNDSDDEEEEDDDKSVYNWKRKLALQIKPNDRATIPAYENMFSDLENRSIYSRNNHLSACADKNSEILTKILTPRRSQALASRQLNVFSDKRKFKERLNNSVGQYKKFKSQNDKKQVDNQAGELNVKDRINFLKALRIKAFEEEKRKKIDEDSKTVSSSFGSHRLFGKTFSPTIHTPDKPVGVEATIALNSIRDLFLKAILGIDSSFLVDNFNENIVFSQISSFYQKEMKIESSNFAYSSFNFDSFQQYVFLFSSLIGLETFAQIVQSFQSLETSGLSGKEISMVKTNEIREKKFVHLVFRSDICKPEELLSLQNQFQNWLVIIRFIRETNFLHGFVEKTRSEKLTPNQLSFRCTVRVSSNSYQKYAAHFSSPEKSFKVQPVFYLRPNLRLIETLSLIENKNHSFFKIFLKPDKNDFLACDRPCSNINQTNRFKFFEESRYNQQQRLAIISSYNLIHQPFSKNQLVMIQGPPGTGKTHTLIGIIKNIFVNNCGVISDDEQVLRLLVCAPSNGAIDEIARRLIRQSSFLKPYGQRSLRIVRIGQSEQVHPDVQSIFLENLLTKNPSRKKKKVNRFDLLKRADVILSTLSSCQQSSMDMFQKLSSKTALRCVIIDEASQCIEPEVLMPLVYPSVTKFILIGDHIQLPPTVISKKAIELKLNRSLFERFWCSLDQQKSKIQLKPSTIRLNVQFRMHPEICQFPSTSFYEGQLQTSERCSHSMKKTLPSYLVFDIFDSIESSGTRNNFHSKVNNGEANFIVKLVRQISDNNDYCSSPSIGIITFYRGQKNVIIQRLEESFDKNILDRINVNTVDAFQGQERDIVILSCVRAFDIKESSIGFLRSRQRLNVALTRAKQSLFVCLHRSSLERVSLWKSLINDARTRGKLFSVQANIDQNVLKVLLNQIN